MKRVVLGGLLVALVGTLAACPPAEREPADAARAIDQLREEYLAAYNRQDAEAVARLYTTDAVMLDGDGIEFTGRDQIEQQLERVFTQSRPQLTASPIETESDGRLGWEYGSFELRMQQMPGQPGTVPPPGEPGTTPQPGEPGQPGTVPPPGEPGTMPGQAQTQRGHYLIVLEPDNDRWLIRAQMLNVGVPGQMPHPPGMPHPTMPGEERPLEPGLTPPPTQPAPTPVPPPGEPTQPPPAEPGTTPPPPDEPADPPPEP